MEVPILKDRFAVLEPAPARLSSEASALTDIPVILGSTPRAAAESPGETWGAIPEAAVGMPWWRYRVIWWGDRAGGRSWSV